ncbi:MAG: esterase [Verrucomicrobiales bacterium]|nr:esterase [Verrucomicrobiales bacterium]MDB6129881.1 esterase [Verrucomicrobiales bacterium]
MADFAPAHAGTILERDFPSVSLGGNRRLRVYLPPGYSEGDRRFPVLYLHDGQNVFSTAGPYIAFGWGNWNLDKTADELIDKKKTAPFIMVAIDCGKDRYTEYLGTSTNRNSRFDKYAKFLIEELKPVIDKEYRTLADPKNTKVMGSSMGGISSLALAWEHRDIFGGAASLSGAYQVEKRYFLDMVLKPTDKPGITFPIYLDSGVMDYSGGDDGRTNTFAVYTKLKSLGWPEKQLSYYVDEKPATEEEMMAAGLPENKRKEALTSQHNEFYWKLRSWRPLTFLFPP